MIWPSTRVAENIHRQWACALSKARGGSDHTRDCIETVPKQGYRFVAAVRTEDRAAGADDVGGRSGVRSNAARTAVLVLSVLVAAAVGVWQGWWGPPRRNL